MLLALSSLLLLGLLLGFFAQKNHFPALAGYLLIGIILGPGVTGVLPASVLKNSIIFEELALLLIAISIGGELSWKNLRQVSNYLLIFTITQVVFSLFFVTSILLVVGFDFNLSLILGAIAAASAPAATMSVIRECKARGKLTCTLLGVVALSDAFSILLFGFLLSFVESGAVGVNLWSPLIEITQSIFMGIFLGSLALLLSPLLKKERDIIVFLGFLILFLAAITTYLGLSLLLVGLSVGFFLANNEWKTFFHTLEEIELPFYILLFSLAGAHLKPGIIGSHISIIIFYILSRTLGKILSSWGAGSLVKAPFILKKQIGLSLLPQGGVSIGLAILAGYQLPAFRDTLLTVTIVTTLFFILLGSYTTRHALEKAGESRAEKKKL